MKNFNHLPMFIKEVYKLYARQYWCIAGLSVSGGIIIRLFDLHEFIVGPIVFGTLILSLFFYSSASLMPSTNADSDRFSWKYLQALPLSKSEILLGLVCQNLFIGSVFLIWLISYLPQVILFISEGKTANLEFVYFLVVAYFPLMSIVSFQSISKQILYPRRQYSKVDSKKQTLKLAKFIFIGVTSILYLNWFEEIFDPFNFTLPESVISFIKETLKLIFSWWILLPASSIAILCYFRTLKIWQNDTIGHIDNSWRGKKDWAILGVCIVLTVFALTTNDFKTPDHFKNGPFQKSVYYKNWSIIKTLAADEKEINKQNAYGLTPLHVAVLNNDFKTYKYLLDQGADPSIPVKGRRSSDYEDMDIMRLAILSDSSIIIDHLLKNEYNTERVVSKNLNTPLHFAASRCKTKIIDQLISYGANVNAVNEKGSTPLHKAASLKCFGAVTALMDSGANPRIINKEKQRALDLIKESSNKELVYYLEKKTRAPASIKK